MTRDGHQLTLEINTDRVQTISLVILCPHRDTDLASVEFDKLPPCRQVWVDVDKPDLAHSPAEKCAVQEGAPDVERPDLDQITDVVAREFYAIYMRHANEAGLLGGETAPLEPPQVVATMCELLGRGDIAVPEVMVREIGEQLPVEGAPDA